MPTGTKTKQVGLRRFFLLCPVRHVLLLLGAAVIGAYFALRGNSALMNALSEGFVRPCHRLLGRLCSLARFSVAEWIYALLIAAGLAYIVFTLVQLIRRGGRGLRLYRGVLTLATAAAVFYALFCLLWGVYYYADSFAGKAELDERAVTVEELETVTRWFAQLANEYAPQVERDASGAVAVDRDWILDRGETLYREIETLFPQLKGPELRPKPMVFSQIMSLINFTGFFFPFTGEANLNMDSPVCMLPSTVAHELAHQRGVAAEQEANFVAVVASLESGDATFTYSSALLAYVHLGNALHSADYQAWEGVYATLSATVRADLAENSAYWSRYETKVAEASEAVYTGFLHSYGQSLGMQSYGACVDLLTVYYYDTARLAQED